MSNNTADTKPEDTIKDPQPEAFLRYKKVHPDAPDLERAYDKDAGFDLSSMTSLTLMARTQKSVPTGIKVDLPEGYYGQIFERSGLSMRTTVGVKAGVIDPGYTGEIKVILYNYGDYPAKIEKGDGIAQLILLPTTPFKGKEIEEINKDSEREDKGFGSSDKQE